MWNPWLPEDRRANSRAGDLRLLKNRMSHCSRQATHHWRSTEADRNRTLEAKPLIVLPQRKAPIDDLAVDSGKTNGL